MYSVENLSFKESKLQLVGKSSKPPRHRQGEKFLKGPIPWSWLAKAAQLPGKALHVAIAIWHLAGMQNSRTVKLSASLLKELGVERKGAYRAVKAMEERGLISVKRQKGQSPQITITY